MGIPQGTLTDLFGQYFVHLGTRGGCVLTCQNCLVSDLEFQMGFIRKPTLVCLYCPPDTAALSRQSRTLRLKLRARWARSPALKKVLTAVLVFHIGTPLV